VFNETLHGVYPERDSSVASLPQNDRKRRVQDESVLLTLSTDSFIFYLFEEYCKEFIIKPMKKILLVAGETSTDLYGAYLISALKERTKEPVDIFGLGGPRMGSAGMRVIRDFTKEAGTGLDPLTRFTYFARTFRQLVSYIKKERPDVAVLMDLPDFNLRLAKEIKRLHIPIVYYISPQVWAWRSSRIKTIAKLVDKMLVIFEFEKDLYAKYNIPVVFVGHPLLDVIGEIRNPTPNQVRGEIRNRLGIKQARLVIGLLPGSRKSEFIRHFPIMLKSAGLIRDKFSDAVFVLACAPQVTDRLVNQYLNKTDMKIHTYFNQTYNVMQASDLLITASGTATVESAIFGTPLVVIYKVSIVTASILGPLIKTPYYAMVNIIAGKKIVPELMQSEANPKRIANEVIRLIEGTHLKQVSDELLMVRERLGTRGASQRAADEIIKLTPDYAVPNK